MTSKHNCCLICNNQNLTKLKGYQKAHLVRCNSCGFVFSELVPTQQELTKHYEGYSRNDYLSPTTIKRYIEMLDSFETYRKTNKILDVGCGIGFFLEEAKKRGWEVHGTEFTDEAVKICNEKGIKIEHGKLNVSNYENNSFDIITSFEVIEHINNPKEELSNFNKILRNGGLVYITTPNFNSILRHRLKSNYNVICYPEHLSYYTAKTLKNVFRSQGFKSLQIETTGISLTRLRTSKGTSNQQYISKTSDDELLRNKLETSVILKALKKVVNRTLTILSMGDSLKGRFVKI